MACYVLRCNKCNKIIEKITSYENAKKIKCEKCDEVMEIIPSKSLFKVMGFSSLNNYECPEFNYAGEDVTWEK